MKKIFKNMAWMLTATLVMAACSDSLDESDNTGQGPVTGEGYVKVAIHTPTNTESMTRADDGSADFEDGTTNEYQINDGVIVFFKTTKPNAEAQDPNPDTEATFVSAYFLEGLTPQGGDNHQISEKVVTVSAAPMINKNTEKLYALVILNTPSVVTVNANDHSLKLGNVSLTTSSKFSTFTETLTNQSLNTYTGNNDDFTMCNAPLSTVAGNNLGSQASSAVAKTLVPVEVYPTQNDALNEEAASIYVERVVAKVTLTGFTDGAKDVSGYFTEYKKNVKGTAGSVYNGDVVQLTGWILNVTNKSTALVRNVSGFKVTDGWLATATGAENKLSRFAGTSVIPVSDNTNYYRIYWAEDGNYNSTSATDFTTYSATSLPNDWNTETADNTTTATDHALYCLENTMAADQQEQDQTTSVLLKTTYLSKFGNQTEPTDQDFFICGASPIKYPAVSGISADNSENFVEDLISFVVRKIKVVLPNFEDNSLAFVNALSDDMDEPAAGIYDNDENKDFSSLFTYNGSKYESEEVWNAIKSQIGTIRYYKKGISYYYATAIRHFNDNETPWTSGEAYGIQHLGRYGVVRNNWYEVNINSISGPGEPEIVQPSGPDDKTEGYIRAEINVLSWAKRSQGVDL